MISWRSRVVTIIAAPTVGILIGTLGPLLMTVSNPIGHATHLAVSGGWSWAALAFAFGIAGKSKVESAVLALVALVVAVISYYLTKVSQGGFTTLDLNSPSAATPYVSWGDFVGKTFFWCVAACILGPVIGLAGHLAKNRSLRGLPFRLLVPLVTIAEMSERLRTEASLQGAVAYITWSAILVIAIVVAIALVGDAIVTSRAKSSVRQVQE
ncbi:DUF6518 family protein [Streptomyces regalis]|uniref:DUF6518 family protein n=1 Tax=Streptomyces regalis TaxID=68262 RepID=UPI00099ED6EC|nr:DUF6518 family protein [Streptomyces regalis]